MEPNQSDATSDELLDAAVKILRCGNADVREAAREGLEQITARVRADLEKTTKSSRAVVAERLAKLAEAAKTTSATLRDPDVRSVLERHMRAINLSRDLPDDLPRRLRTLANTASKAAADPDLHGGGDAGLDDVFDLPAKTKLAALVDPVFTHFRGKQGAARANSDLDVLLNHLWEVISGDDLNQSFERPIQQARAKKGRDTSRRLAALVDARVDARYILDAILEKSQR